MPDTQSSFGKIIDRLQQELATIRTDRANPAMVEQVLVDAYDTQTPLVQLATITVPEARTILVQPWDATILKDIETALQQADLGAQPTVDSESIRMMLPPMTEERREDIVKTVGEKLEAARIAVKTVRTELLKKSKAQLKEGSLSEDEYFAEEKGVQKEVDEAQATLQEIAEKKEKEVRTV